jgi:hypothetical protein
VPSPHRRSPEWKRAGWTVRAEKRGKLYVHFAVPPGRVLTVTAENLPSMAKYQTADVVIFDEAADLTPEQIARAAEIMAKRGFKIPVDLERRSA